MWRKTMLYLGLGPDEEYEEYDPSGNEEPAGARASGGASSLPPATTTHHPEEPSAIGSVRPINPQVTPQTDDSEDRREVARVEPSGGGRGPFSRPRPAVVRPLPPTPNAKPQVVVPTSFNQAQEVADKFKGSQPVIVNMQNADRDLARRLIDFASGLCYGLGGQMEKVGNQVYLLTPSNVEVSPEDRRRLQERNFDH